MTKSPDLVNQQVDLLLNDLYVVIYVVPEPIGRLDDLAHVDLDDLLVSCHGHAIQVHLHSNKLCKLMLHSLMVGPSFRPNYHPSLVRLGRSTTGSNRGFRKSKFIEAELTLAGPLDRWTVVSRPVWWNTRGGQG